MDLQRDGARSTQFRFRQVGLALPNRQLIRTIGKAADCRVFWSLLTDAVMFLIESSLGLAPVSRRSKMDALTFLGDGGSIASWLQLRQSQRVPCAAHCGEPIRLLLRDALRVWPRATSLQLLRRHFWKWNAISERRACVQSPPTVTSFKRRAGPSLRRQLRVRDRSRHQPLGRSLRRCPCSCTRTASNQSRPKRAPQERWW